MRDLDDVLGDLAVVRDALDALDDGPSAERDRLKARREQLRLEAREIHAEAAPEAAIAALRSELNSLVAAWDRLAARRIDVVKQAGGGSSGGDFGFATDAQRLNRHIDEVGDRAGIEARIRELRALIEKLESG